MGGPRKRARIVVLPYAYSFFGPEISPVDSPNNEFGGLPLELV